MAYVSHIPDWFDTRKAANVAAFFIAKSGGTIAVLKLTKLMYLSDRKSMEDRDFPITNDLYVSMKFGPVNSYTYDYIKGNACERVEQWAEFIGARSVNTLSLAQDIDIDVDLDELSRGDLKILEAIWDKWKDIDRFDLAQWTHENCPEWKDPGNSAIPIDYSSIFKEMDKQDPIGLSEDLQNERRLVSMLRGE